MVCAASYDPEAEVKLDKKAGIIHNGTVQLITAAGAVTQVYEASTKGNVALPIVGIAVGPSASQAVRTAAPSTNHFVNFGPVSVAVETPNACKLDITLRQLSAADTQTKLTSASVSNQYGPDPPLGGESWFDNVIVTPAGGNCGVSGISPARLRLFQFNDIKPNRALLHCKGASCTPTTETEHPYALPDDGDTVGRPDDFSDFLTATITFGDQ